LPEEKEAYVIICPACHHEELVGALFCSECGAELFHLKVSPPKTRSYDTSGALPQTGRPKGTGPSSVAFTRPPTAPLVALKVVDTGQVIPLESGDEFTLGRISGNQPILPDIDLTPYKAYEGGVSRLHATIRLVENQITITDLGSANGTRINGKKIAAHQPCQVNHEDIIALGRFKAQVLIQRR
jgi:pSer/pThr/pTyr-binding forkhead associated (FHA) protein